eukprot:jgi/Chrzof1/12294/Cz06g29060.t1
MVLGGILRCGLPVHDISTNYIDVPQFVKGPQSQPQLIWLLGTFYADIQPLVVATKDVSKVYALATEAAQSMPNWTVAQEDPTSGRIQALAVTPRMQFKDDVIIRVRQQGDNVAVDTRSRSRVGVGDMGANGHRILQYQKKLSELLGDNQLSKL